MYNSCTTNSKMKKLKLAADKLIDKKYTAHISQPQQQNYCAYARSQANILLNHRVQAST